MGIQAQWFYFTDDEYLKNLLEHNSNENKK